MTRRRRFSLSVRSLSSIASEFQHDQLDILKMDIEGSEYGVLENIESWGISVKLLLIEFHHRFDSISVSKTASAITCLQNNGFTPYWLSDSGEEFGFVHADFAP